MTNNQKCLGCYQKLNLKLHSGNYHITCSKKLFGVADPPIVDFGSEHLKELARISISKHLGITGVQPKLSVELDKSKHSNDPTHRLMIVGLWGNFILKPPTKRFPNISVIEDATMHMANAAGIATAKHGLIQLKSGEFAYLTKRFDRDTKKKIAMEDFCQLSELLSESKYDTSTEKAGKLILKYSAHPGLDAVTFFDINIFSFLVGNADMHLKNFSLMRNENNETVLAPAYDLLSTKLLLAEDKEEMALTVNGKKAKIKRDDFVSFGKSLKISEKAIENSINRVCEAIPAMTKVIESSFIPNDMKKAYKDLLIRRLKVLG